MNSSHVFSFLNPNLKFIVIQSQYVQHVRKGLCSKTPQVSMLTMIPKHGVYQGGVGRSNPPTRQESWGAFSLSCVIHGRWNFLPCLGSRLQQENEATEKDVLEVLELKLMSFGLM